MWYEWPEVQEVKSRLLSVSGTKWYSVTSEWDFFDGRRWTHVCPHEVSDLLSVPRPLRWIIKPHRPKYIAPALIHDTLYRRGKTSRHQADRTFLKALRFSGVRFPYVFYVAVRLFGWVHWFHGKTEKTELAEYAPANRRCRCRHRACPDSNDRPA